MHIRTSMLIRYFLLSLLLAPVGLSAADQGIVVRMETSLGNIEVELFDTVAPLTVANFMNYVNDGDFTNSFVHRSVPGFIIQGGGFTFENGVIGTVPTDSPVVNEFNRSNLRGTIAMAKLSGDPDSATSGWFFNLADNSANLDTQNGGFTVFGKVIGSGMDVVDAIAALTVWNVGGAFTDLPLIDYSGTGDILQENLVMIYRIATVSTSSEDLCFPIKSSNDKFSMICL
jgi:peptidyl-prolyl cis-trans isomerase A (cyclophilin A)